MTVKGGVTDKVTDKVSDYRLAFANLLFTNDLVTDRNSYGTPSKEDPTPTPQLSQLRLKGEYLGYLSNFLYQELPPHIKNSGLRVQRSLSKVTSKIPYQGYISQPAMLNISLDFDTKFIKRLSV